jgi:hypothetical protein
MGKSLAATLASLRCRAPAWLADAGGALASIVLPAAAGFASNCLSGASRLPVCEDCLASFSRIRGNLCRECGVPIEAVSGDQDGDGSGELFEDVCIACRSEKFHFDRAEELCEVSRFTGSRHRPTEI